ncbi:hypothetical protein J1605_015637 [Eschrichtius robustus]|uniref:Uncharacterized protein n=1 Tax=Eschrichtius robustus TaxID=9764 RepID=A0AB34G9A7_ESCRO|nr:hypothetical protein J1605_015637 [Eschrichtius robustus]
MGALRRKRPRRRQKRGKQESAEREEGRGGAAGGRQRRGSNEGVPKGFTLVASRPASCVPLFLSSPGNRRRKEGYRRAPDPLPAPLADMAADQLSQSLLGSPAARVEETPLAFPPRLPLRTPPGWLAGWWPAARDRGA